VPRASSLRRARRGPLRLLRTAIGAVTALAVVAALPFVRSIPPPATPPAVAGQGAEITVARDAHGIPAIVAADEPDALAALGIVHAQDRLWQMELQRRLGTGRLAEVLGAPALPIDRWIRTLGLPATAEREAAAAAPATRQALAAYAAGVNAVIAEAGRPPPPEFLLLRHRPEAWRPADSLAVLQLLALDLSGDWRSDILRAEVLERLGPAALAALWPGRLPDEPDHRPPHPQGRDGPPAGPGGLGSNVVVVGGARTRSGLPILASDPHLGLRAPGTWYLASLVAGGRPMAGGTIPGLPLVVIGRSRTLAWGLTTTHADVQDVVVERLDPDDPERYMGPTGPRPFDVRAETIAVRGGPPVALRARATRHGPVISDLVGGAPPGHVLVLAWAVEGAAATLEAALGVMRADDVATAIRALAGYMAPVQNVALADAAGTIALQTAGRLPLRTDGDGRLPVAGAALPAGPPARVPFERLPRSLDPPDGLVINANDAVVGAGASVLVAADGPPDQRARRLRALLDGAADLDRTALARVQLDRRSMLAVDLGPALLAATRAAAIDPGLAAALHGWDGVAAADRPEPLVLAAWVKALGRRLWGEPLGPLAARYGVMRPAALTAILAGDTPFCSIGPATDPASCAARAAAALDDAVRELGGHHGPDWRAWRWGDAHAAVMEHAPFERVPALRALFSLRVPVGGDASTVAVAHPRWGEGPDGFEAVHMAGLRLVTDLADDTVLVAVATGQSGHPLSPHYRDLMRLWAADRYLELRTGAPAVPAGGPGAWRPRPATIDTPPRSPFS
jgi:penicillin amidase